MKKTTLSYSLLGALTLFLAGSGVWSNLHGQQGNPGNEPSIVGSWDLVIPTSPFRILRTYDSGGGVVDAYAFPPFTPTQGPLINSTGHGTWVRTGPRTYKVLVKYFQLDPSKNAQFAVLDSIGTVAETVTMGPDLGPVHASTYSSTFLTTVNKPDGSVVLQNPGGTTGVRITVQ